MNLHFTNYRQPTKASDLTETLKKQILFDTHRDGLPEDLDGTIEDMMEYEELSGLELVDVADEQGNILYQAWFYDFGTAMFFKNNTIIEVGGACQHSVECDDPKFYKAMQVAYQNADPKIEQMMDF